MSLGRNFEALEFARSLGLIVAINLIADPDWDHERFRVVREWGLEIPEVVNLSVNTPYPGTESWLTEERVLTSRDYRLYDIAHAVMPTRLPLAEFYQELVTTQRAFYRKFAGWRAAYAAAGIVARQLLRGHPNFLKSLYLLDKVYRPELLLADHGMPVAYEIPLPAGLPRAASRGRATLHSPAARPQRAGDRRRDREFRRGDPGGRHALSRARWRGRREPSCDRPACPGAAPDVYDMARRSARGKSDAVSRGSSRPSALHESLSAAGAARPRTGRRRRRARPATRSG